MEQIMDIIQYCLTFLVCFLCVKSFAFVKPSQQVQVVLAAPTG